MFMFCVNYEVYPMKVLTPVPGYSEIVLFKLFILYANIFEAFTL